MSNLVITDKLRLEEIAIKIDARGKATVEYILEIGMLLCESRSIFPSNKDFGEWRENRLPWLHRKLASRWMNAYQNGGEKLLGHNVTTTAIYQLTAPSVPDSAREEAIEKAEQGESITVKQAKEIADLHKRIEQADEEIADAYKEVKRANRSEKIADKAIIRANEVRNDIQEKYDKLQADYEDAVDEGARKVIRKKQRELDQLKLDLADQIRKEMSEAIERKVREDLDENIKASSQRAEKAEREADRHKQRANGLAEDNLYERSRAEKLESELNAALPVEKDAQHARSLSFILSDLKSILEKTTNDCESHQREQSDIKVRELIEAAQTYLGSAPTFIDI